MLLNTVITPLKNIQLEKQNHINDTNNRTKENSISPIKVSPNLSMIYFGSIIPPAKRLSKSDYLISSYIREIGKARNFHGDKSVVDLSMGNPDLTPPEKAKTGFKKKK